MRRFLVVVTTLALIFALPLGSAAKPKADEAKKKDDGPWASSSFSGLAWRSVGPAFTSGRISDIAVDPTDEAVWYVAVASGGVWKTTNAGTTFEPLFDGQGSYSIGCVTLDPNDPKVVWVGTGENNSQRSVSYGDGVYKSLDGGRTWKNVGLKGSEHIGKIVVDPRDSDVVYVAAQGPLWNAGGDRGLYKTTDGGATWERVLEISEHTGVSDLVMDPRNPDTLIAAAYQRRRHVWTLIDGGPESGLHKSTDGGETWREITSGLPSVDLGRIGLAISPVDPEVVYAIVEAAREEGGFYRSTDLGENWTKQSGYVSGSPQYYQELVPDPHDVDRVYSMDTWLQVTEDAGVTWRGGLTADRHVDDHAMWIDPDDPDHLLNGNDGGLYESWDRGATWDFKENLPVTQFYRVSVDQAAPFYNIYGGTQDNFSLGGPSRTFNRHGIVNSDWYVTQGGDGFETVVDPTDPNVVYSQYQYGGLARFDRRSGQGVDIQPQPEPGDPPLKWNWDSPLLLSPHSPTRLYFGANVLFRSDDRGNTWTQVSPDLTRGIDRNRLEVMGRIWSVDAVAKNASTSFYGNLVALDESPLAEGLLYAGTDDGLIQVTENGGGAWREVGSFPGVPDRTYVSDVQADLFDADTVYASFDAHKSGDFRPYLLKSTDRGRTWTSIAGDLPERGTVYTVIQDHRKPELLFAGTEFGAFFSPDGGGRWIQLKAGMPTIAVRDLEIQRREEDLVAGTFGRGFYVLDDYTPLRSVTAGILEGETPTLFDARPALRYLEEVPLGLPGKAFQGASYYTAPNPPYGAVITYYLPEAIETLQAQRWEREEELRKEKSAEDEEAERRASRQREIEEREIDEVGGPLFYPKWEDLRSEAREEDPTIVLTVTDADGAVVRRIGGPVGKGFHRVAWDLRYPSPDPVRLTPADTSNPFVSPPIGPLVTPGTYRVTLHRRVRDELVEVAGPREIEVVDLERETFQGDPAEVLAFQREVADLQRAVRGAVSFTSGLGERIDFLQAAVDQTVRAEAATWIELRELEHRLEDLDVLLTGDPVIAGYNEPTPPSIADRVGRIVWGSWMSTAPVTQTNRRAYEIAGAEFTEALADLRQLAADVEAMEDRLEALGAPWTPGRLPDWPRRDG